MTARYLVDKVSTAHLVEVAGRDFIPINGDREELLSEVDGFVDEMRHLKGVPGEWRLYAVER